MVVKMVRPTDTTFANYFYDLADFNASKRIKAAADILRYPNLEEHRDYTLQRLVKGLASGKSGARFGFSTLLTALLKRFDGIKLDEMFEMIEKELPDDNDAESGNIVGRHFAYLCLANCGVFDKRLAEIVKRDLQLVEEAPFLTLAVVSAISKKAETLSEVAFKKQVLPSVKPFVQPPLGEISIIGLSFLLELGPVYPKLISTISPNFDSRNFSLSDAEHEHLAELLKSLDAEQRLAFSLRLLNIAKAQNQFQEVFSGVVEKAALTGDDAKGSERYFTLMEFLFLAPSIGANELLQLFSKKFTVQCRKYSHRSDPVYRGHQNLILRCLEAFKLRVEEGLIESKDVARLISLIDSVETGDFDTRIGGKLRFTEFLVTKLSEYDLEGFSHRVVKEPQWSLKRLVPAFGLASSATKNKILQRLISNGERSEGRFNVACALLDHLFKMLPKKGFLVTLEESDADSLLQVTSTDTKGVKQGKRPFALMSAALKILYHTAATDEDSVTYLNECKEALSMAKTDVEGRVVIDFCLSILSKVNRVHKSLVFYAFHCVVDQMSPSDIEFLTQIIGEGSASLSNEGDDSDDGDGKPITEEERAAVHAKWAAEEEEEDAEEEEEDEQVDERLVADVKGALGKFALNDSDDSDIEMTEQDMDELDRSLGVALRKHTSQGKREQTENVALFRVKCLDLLTLYFYHAPVLVPCLASLAELVVELDSLGVEGLFGKVDEVLEAVRHHKKKPVAEDEAEEAFQETVQVLGEARSIRARRLVADIVILVIGFSADHDAFTVPDSVTNSFWQLVVSFFDGEHSATKPALKELIGAVLSRYPHYFKGLFSKIAGFLASPDLSLENKTECIRWISFACRKDVIGGDKADKISVKLLQSVLPSLKNFFESLETNSPKPFVFSKWLGLLYKLVHFCPKDRKDIFTSLGFESVLASADFEKHLGKAQRQVQAEVKAKPAVCVQKIVTFLTS